MWKAELWLFVGFLFFSTLCHHLAGISPAFKQFNHIFNIISNWSTLNKGDNHNPAFPHEIGYYVKVVIVEVVIANLGKHQLPMKCLGLAATGHTANHMFFKHASKKCLGYNHPGYDHLCVVLRDGSVSPEHACWPVVTSCRYLILSLSSFGVFVYYFLLFSIYDF